MKSTILIRVNPNTDGSFSVVLTNHNIPGAENRQQVSRPDFAGVQTAVTDFLTSVVETDAAQVAEAERKAAEQKAKDDAAKAAAAARAEAERQAAEKAAADAASATAPGPEAAPAAKAAPAVP